MGPQIAGIRTQLDAASSDPLLPGAVPDRRLRPLRARRLVASPRCWPGSGAPLPVRPFDVGPATTGSTGRRGPGRVLGPSGCQYHRRAPDRRKSPRSAVINFASSLASQHTVSAMSSGPATQVGRNGSHADAAAGWSHRLVPASATMSPVPMAVLTGPGCTLLTRMSVRPVRRRTPAPSGDGVLAGGVVHHERLHLIPAAELIRMIEPPRPPSMIVGRPAITAFQVPVTLMSITSRNAV